MFNFCQMRWTGFLRFAYTSAMKRLNLKRAAVVETQGVFEDLDAVRDITSQTRRHDDYFTDDETVNEASASIDSNATQSGS